MRVETHVSETRDSIAKRIWSFLLKQNTCNAVIYDFTCAPLAQGDHRLPARLRLNHDDSEVLLAGEDKSSAALHGAAQHRRGLRPEKANIGARLMLKAPAFRSVADDDELFSISVERLDGQVEALVGDVRRHG